MEDEGLEGRVPLDPVKVSVDGALAWAPTGWGQLLPVGEACENKDWGLWGGGGQGGSLGVQQRVAPIHPEDSPASGNPAPCLPHT